MVTTLHQWLCMCTGLCCCLSLQLCVCSHHLDLPLCWSPHGSALRVALWTGVMPCRCSHGNLQMGTGWGVWAAQESPENWGGAESHHWHFLLFSTWFLRAPHPQSCLYPHPRAETPSRQMCLSSLDLVPDSGHSSLTSGCPSYCLNYMGGRVICVGWPEKKIVYV